MSEEIEIGVDASDALRGLGDIGKAFENLSKQAGLNSREMNRANSQMEKGIATVAGAIAKQAAARKADLQTISEQITAEQKLAAIKRAEAVTGSKANSAGQVVDANTGRFKDGGSRQFYENQIALAERLAGREGDLARQRERAARQQQLEAVFARQFYGTADEGASKLTRVANIMRQIPPATWSRALGDASAKVMEMGNSARYAMYDVSNSFGIAGAAVAGLGVLAIASAVSHERAFANVERTTQTTARGYEILRRQLEVMSMEIPVSFEGLTQIAQAAGQLGISASGVQSFTSTVAKLSATTNLTADAAGIALARFRAFFSESDTAGLAVTEATFSNLASSILKVGVNSIASETGIVNVATQIASMADYAGYTANQVVGLAGALSSIGVAPELARGTITRTFSLIGNAVSSGGVQLEKFANLAGISSAQFVEAWGSENFAGVFTDLVAGIGQLDDKGKDANLQLMELGFNSVRDRPLLLRLAEAADEAGNAGGLLAQTMRDAATGWRENSELALQYSKISTTTSARLQVLAQTFEQFAATTGSASGGFLGEVAVQLTALVRGFEELANSDVGQMLGSVAVQATLVVGGLALLIAAGARTVASIQGIGQAMNVLQEVGVSTTAKLTAGFRIMSLSLGVLGILGAIAGVVAGFVAMDNAGRTANRAVKDTNGLLQAMATDAQNGSAGLTFYSNAAGQVAAEEESAAKQAAGMTDALYGVGTSARAGTKGMNDLAGSAKNAAYVFGDAAKEFYRAQLVQSESFQELFDPGKQWGATEFANFAGKGVTLEQMGIRPEQLDWDGLMRKSMQGAIDADDIYKDLLEVGNITERNPFGSLTAEALSAQTYAEHLAQTFGDMGTEIQKAANSASALGATGSAALNEFNAGAIEAEELMGSLDEATQKAVDKMAGGFAKFVDPKALIGLTQQMISTEEGAAEAYEKAWSDAYGGAAFKLEDYLVNFRRAGEEQRGFIEGLQQLGAAGVSPAILQDLSEMGPEANRLVQAMVADINATGGAGLGEFEALWGQTGYDAMVAFAVQAQLGQQVINNVMNTGGYDALKAFNAALSTGMGVDAALAEIQHDLNGNKLKPKIDKVPPPPNLTAWEKQQWANANRLRTTGTVDIAVPILSGAGVKIGTKILTPYAEGGYTGAGGKYDPAGVVHAGEFVMTAAATRAIGVNNLYAMMKAAQGGRSAPRGRGYASGGAVNSVGVNVVALSPEDRALLRSLQPLVRIGNRDIAQAQAEASFRSTREGVG